METLAAIDAHLLERGLAIVGMGACLPDAPNVAAFWRNIQAAHVSIGQVPPERWSPAHYYSPDRQAPERTYSQIGAFVRYDNFDRKLFRVVPRSVPAIDEVQKWSLMAVAEALGDAGLQVFAHDSKGRAFNRERCAVIMGNAMGGEQAHKTNLRIVLNEVRESLTAAAMSEGIGERGIESLLARFYERTSAVLPVITEDSMVGELSNCITGRIANAFDLLGPNYTTDAACASSMAALSAAAQGLYDNSFDIALVGGADRSMDPATYVKFAKIGALSAEGSMPFDARASGFVMGEGAGVMVVKRLADALRDNDKIHAVVRGFGSSSDGAGKGLTAPNPRGQRLAIERAWQSAGVPLTSVGLIEAHGTSTPVGDQLELSVLTELLSEGGAAAREVPVGSIKSMIGHLKSAAGAASLIKATLALREGILPPSANFRAAKDDSPLHRGYLKVNTQARAWPDSAHPRRAGVSSFGFGGINFHVVLEHLSADRAAGLKQSLEQGVAATPQRVTLAAAPSAAKIAALAATPQPAGQAAPAAHASEAELTSSVVDVFAEQTGYGREELELDHHLEGDLGIDSVKQAEILALLRQRYALPRAPEQRLSELNTLRAIVAYLGEQVRRTSGADAPSEPSVPAPSNQQMAPLQPRAPAQAAAPHNAALQGPQVLAFGGATLAEAIATGEALLAEGDSFTPAMLAPRASVKDAPHRVAMVAASPAAARAQLKGIIGKRPALLAAKGIFVAAGKALGAPEQVCFLFPGQGSQYLGMLQDLAADYAVVRDTFATADRLLTTMMGRPITPVIWPPEHTPQGEEALKQTDMCQPSMLTADVAMLRLLAQFNLKPASTAGHSLGEYAAAVAADVMSFDDALYAVSARGREMANVQVADSGKMAVVAATSEVVEAELHKIDGYVIAANKNCHTQTVIAGATASVEAALAHFATLGLEAQLLPVSHAFHSEIVAPATEPLRRVLNKLTFHRPSIPLCANADAQYFPAEREQIIALMARQLASPVEFIKQIEQLYAGGARLFIEAGPRRALTGFVRNVLGEREHRAVASNHPKKSGQEGLLELLAAALAEGADVRFDGPQQGSEVARERAHVAHKPASQLATHASARSTHVPISDDAVVVSGMSALLPREVPVGTIDADPLAPLLLGDNFITPLAAAAKEALIAKKIARLDKTRGEFIHIDSEEGVLKLAGTMGDIDLSQYGVDEALAGALDVTGRMSLAVGIDALRDAGLPLVRHMRTTSTGSKLFDRWGLPAQLGERTGVILASAFPGLDAAFTVHQQQGQPFDRKWLFRVLPLGHAQLAQWVLAQGPNTQINAACASGTQAVALGHDWIRLGRCDRVIVLSADDISRPESLPHIGAGFLAVGSASIEADVARAAVPFGTGRNGLVLGAGATALVLERQRDVAARGMVPLAEIVATHLGNSAFHGTRLDSHYIARFFAAIVAEASNKLEVSVQKLAERLVFMSHETYTPARGGSSQAEVDALRHAFGAAADSVLIANTKGYTGHAMGASLEDACAIRGLQVQQLPGIANAHAIDPAFASLRFAQGGSHHADVALRFAAGFGSQVAAVVYRRRATQMSRLSDAQTYAAWSQSVGVEGGLEVVDRTLRMAQRDGRRAEELGVPALRLAQGIADAAQLAQLSEPARAPKFEPAVQATPAAPAAAAAHTPAAVLATLTQMFADETGYGFDELEPDHALEADLGIDSVKQAELFARVRQHYALEAEPNFTLAQVATLRAWAEHVSERLQSAAPKAAPPAAHAQGAAPSAGEANVQARTQPDEVLSYLVALFAEQTGYSPEELEPDHALEADLGIDSVKQAEMFALVRQHYKLEAESDFSLSQVVTLRAWAEHIATRLGSASAPPQTTSDARTQVAPPLAEATVGTSAKADALVATPAPGQATAKSSAPADATGPAALLERLVTLFAQATGYEREELHPEHALEADLGIDSVKQAEILALVRKEFAVPEDASLRLADMPTLTSMAAQLTKFVSAQSERPAPSAPQKADATTAAARAEVSYSRDALPANDDAPHVTSHLAQGDFNVRRVALVPHTPDAHSKTHAPKGALWLWGDIDKKLARPLVTQLKARGLEARSFGRDEAIGHTLVAAKKKAPEALCIVLPRIERRAEVEDVLAQLFTELHSIARSRTHTLSHLLVLSLHARGLGLIGAAPHTPAECANVELACGASGLLKTMAKEWEATRCLTLDVVAGNSEASLSGEQLAHAVTLGWGEASLYESRELIVRFDEDAQAPRLYTAARVGSALAIEPKPLTAGSQVIVTGGARGVTFELVRALARRRPLDIVLMARTEPLAPEDSPLFNLDAQAARKVALLELTAKGERATPALAKAWVERVEGRIEVWRNLAELKSLGCQIELLRCDLGNAQARQDALRWLRERNKPTALLLHGAGAEESRLLADKDPADYTRLAATKVEALVALCEGLAPARIVTLGSVAGRFGNAGQADYAAANEQLAAQARVLPNTLNLAYTAWEGLGMATRGSTRQVLMGLGVELVPAPIAVALGSAAIESDLCGDTVVAGPLGIMAAHESKPPAPFVSWSPSASDGALRLGATLSPSELVALDHHRIDGVPVLPGVLGFELMVSAAALAKSAPVRYVRDVRFMSPIKSFKGRDFDLEVEVAAPSATGDTQVTLSSFFVTPGGARQRKAHFTLVVPREVPEPIAQVGACVLPLERDVAQLLTREAIYTRYFHGPRFQVLAANPQLSRLGVLAEGALTQEPWLSGELDARAATWPKAREAGFQAAGLWEMAYHERMALPAGIDEVWLSAKPSTSDAPVIEVTPRGLAEDGASYDIYTHTPDGAVDIMRGYRSVVLRPLAAEQRFDVARAPLLMRTLGDKLFCDALPLAQVRGACAPHAQDARLKLLSASEAQSFAQLVHAERKLTWLAGRLVAKRLVQQSWPHPGERPELRDIVIVPDVHGAPQVRIEGSTHAMPSLSLSHAAQVAMAIVSWQPQQQVGIDVEEIKARAQAFYGDYFTSEEQAAMAASSAADEVGTALWAAKEAVLKVLGTHGKIDLRHIAIALAQGDSSVFQVTLRNRALKRAEELGLSLASGRLETLGESHDAAGSPLPSRVVAWLVAERVAATSQDVPNPATPKPSRRRRASV